MRYSSDKQGAITLETQEAKCRGYCEYNDLEVKGVFKDEGLSGRSMKKRIGLQMALACLSKDDTLIVYSMSRASRSVKDMIELLEIIQKKDAHFASVHEKIDTSSAMGKLLFHIFAALSEFESMQTGERVKQNMDQRREMFGTANNKARYGYRYVSHKEGKRTTSVELVQVPEEQEVIAMIKAFYSQPYKRKPNMPFAQIARELEDRHIKSPRGKDEWSPQTIKNILIAEGVLDAVTDSEDEECE